MAPARAAWFRTLSLALVIVGIGYGAVTDETPKSWLGWLMIGCAAVHLINVALLLRGVELRHWTGSSPLGQALLSQGSLALGTLIVAGHDIPAVLGWSVSPVGTAAFLIGLRVEAKAAAAAAGNH